MNINSYEFEDLYQTLHVRLTEEVNALPMSHKEVIRRLECGNSVLYTWLDGRAKPSAYYVAKLALLGCDIVYILTGIHTQGGDFDV